MSGLKSIKRLTKRITYASVDSQHKNCVYKQKQTVIKRLNVKTQFYLATTRNVCKMTREDILIVNKRSTYCILLFPSI